MKISPSKKDKTKSVNLNLSEISNKVYIDNKLWVSTIYDVIKVGIDNGPVYQLVGNELEEIINDNGN
jgi:hypothetical protein